METGPEGKNCVGLTMIEPGGAFAGSTERAFAVRKIAMISRVDSESSLNPLTGEMIRSIPSPIELTSCKCQIGPGADWTWLLVFLLSSSLPTAAVTGFGNELAFGFR